MWATRLAELVRAAGAIAVPVRTAAGLASVLADVHGVIVDLTARAYDGIAAIEAAAALARPVMAVGQHDDRALRRRALDAGAGRVHPYRRLYEDGQRQVGAWLADQETANPTA
jgi:DNA-binding NarL/FixJ family response regulator